MASTPFSPGPYTLNTAMKTLHPIQTTVTSFTSESTQRASGFEYDGSHYILSMASPNDDDSGNSSSSSTSGVIAAALSNRSIVQYDTRTNQIVHRIEKAHDGPISELVFFPREYYGLGNDISADNDIATTAPPATLIMSASQDGTVKLFDLRVSSSSSAMMSTLQHPNEQALSISLGYGGTLAAVGTSKSRIAFFDLRYTTTSCNTNNNNYASPKWMGSYQDAHTDDVTRVRFQTVSTTSQSNSQKVVLASASEDGLLTIHDPSQSTEEAALLSVMNIGSPIRHIGFFGPQYEGVCALTGNETMSVWHWDSAQRISDCGGDGLRGMLSDAVVGVGNYDNHTASASSSESYGGKNLVEYLVGCRWTNLPDHGSKDTTSSVSPALYVIAGNSNGDGYVYRVDANQITPLVHLKGGHRGCIRDFCWSNDGRLVTGGEDARLCQWDLTGDGISSSSGATHSNNLVGGSGKIKRDRSSKQRSEKNDAKGKTKFGSPY
eukprot:scaffold55666_cov43-Cyclotella_meneghiniana.AAC.2